jgi:23S rRNA pseudouridine2605 synthase
MAVERIITERRIESGCALAVPEAERNGIMTRRDSNHHDKSRSNSPSKARSTRDGSQSRTRSKPGAKASSKQFGHQNQHTHEPGPRPDSGPGPGKGERVQKVLAHAGLGSRRSCEDLIKQGRVSIDGQVVRELGTRVDPARSRIAVDGEAIRLESMVYFAVNKPKGYVSTDKDPAGRPRVVDLLPEVPERVYTVGRLDEDSTGLMILTNDGELANRLAHPRYGVEKLYRALVAGSPDQEIVAKLTAGIWLSEGKVRAKRARLLGRQGQANVLELVLAEGKNREIRRMLARLGHKVMSLNRVAVGPISVKGLATGACRSLSRHEVELLRKVANGVPVSLPRFLDGDSTSRHRHDANRHGKVEQARSRRDQAGRSQKKQHSDSVLGNRTPGGSSQAPPPRTRRANQSQPPQPRHADEAARHKPHPQADRPRQTLDRLRTGPPTSKGPQSEARKPGAGSSSLPISPPAKRRIIGLELDLPVVPGAHSKRDRGRKRPPPRKQRQSLTMPLKRPIVPFRPPGTDGDDA